MIYLQLQKSFLQCTKSVWGSTAGHTRKIHSWMSKPLFSIQFHTNAGFKRQENIKDFKYDPLSLYKKVQLRHSDKHVIFNSSSSKVVYCSFGMTWGGANGHKLHFGVNYPFNLSQMLNKIYKSDSIFKIGSVNHPTAG